MVSFIGNRASDGVVLRLDESTGDAPVVSQMEIYNQIYTDCKEAVSLYETTGMDRNASDVWLPNKNVVHAVYARAALNRSLHSSESVFSLQ